MTLYGDSGGVRTESNSIIHQSGKAYKQLNGLLYRSRHVQRTVRVREPNHVSFFITLARTLRYHSIFDPGI